MREAATAILVWPAGRLHHPVQGETRNRNDLAHSLLLLTVTPAPVAVFSLYTNGLRPDRQRPLAGRHKVELELGRQGFGIEQLGTLIPHIVHERRGRHQAQPSVGTRFEE